MVDRLRASGNGTCDEDAGHMASALRLARRALGNCWPNPAVGAVIVDQDSGRILGRGWTQPGGRPHAETEALARAHRHGRDGVAGATVYVTLEPCNHHGRTPPCTQALVEAGVGRVVVGIEDSDERVAGAGIKRLEAAGIRVEIGVGAAAARALNAGYLMRQSTGRPLVTWKTATSLDSRIATHSGDSRWITGEAARARGHLLRAQHDGIMVGAETASRDDPGLDCRLPGLADRTPVRIIVDSRLRLPLTSQLVQSARRHPTWLVTTDTVDAQRVEAHRGAGVEVLIVPAAANGWVDLEKALAALGARGLTRVLVEGGAHLAASLLQASLVDEIAWFRAPKLIG
ncbi:MAG: bifunctional diaminohydroxyphosphoribosylaminopyrimidine deaminase/5-amino-6-(5-phosphoribosylamino)uracil reductase RibD, partial [Alphaproteobacteria bacterium]